MGVVETTLGQLDEAMQAFQKAIDLSGGRYAWAELGSATFFIGRENQQRQ